MIALKPRHAGALALLAVVVSACAFTPQVTTDYDPAHDFAGLRRYAILPTPSAVTEQPLYDDLMARRIEQAIRAELDRRGLEAAARDQADIWVAYHVVTRDRTRVTTYNRAWGYAGCWRCGGLYGDTDVIVSQYTEGELLIDVVDPASERTVWRGTGRGRVLDEATPEQREARVRTTVAAVLADFPPGRPVD